MQQTKFRKKNDLRKYYHKSNENNDHLPLAVVFSNLAFAFGTEFNARKMDTKMVASSDSVLKADVMF